jgi:hypothetical protein
LQKSNTISLVYKLTLNPLHSKTNIEAKEVAQKSTFIGLCAKVLLIPPDHSHLFQLFLGAEREKTTMGDCPSPVFKKYCGVDLSVYAVCYSARTGNNDRREGGWRGDWKEKDEGE